MQNGFEEAAAFGLGGGELRFQPVAQGHQFIHPSDDAVLFSEGRERNKKSLHTADTKVLNCWPCATGWKRSSPPPKPKAAASSKPFCMRH